MALSCFVWPPGLQLWSGWQADENLSFYDLFKILYPATNVFFVVINAVFDVR